MNKEAAIRRVLQVARAEIGYREKRSNASLDDPAANAGGGDRAAGDDERGRAGG